MNLSDLQALTNNTGYITSIQVFAEDSSIVTDVSTAISALHLKLSVVTAQQRLSTLQQMQATYDYHTAKRSISHEPDTKLKHFKR